MNEQGALASPARPWASVHGLACAGGQLSFHTVSVWRRLPSFLYKVCCRAASGVSAAAAARPRHTAHPPPPARGARLVWACAADGAHIHARLSAATPAGEGQPRVRRHATVQADGAGDSPCGDEAPRSGRWALPAAAARDSSRAPSS